MAHAQIGGLGVKNPCSTLITESLMMTMTHTIEMRVQREGKSNKIETLHHRSKQCNAQSDRVLLFQHHTNNKSSS